ncbi:MAG TPA: tRNA pseudouridine(55) synthase TruB [Candidatus Limnocylindrales bacterium]|nr:tRNA pseudouridine(55) synthase TruB [Candidatus Limnocylindrales bacterium]
MATDPTPTDGIEPGRDGAKPARGREMVRLDGVLVVAKEPGPTSHDIVGLVRRLTGVKRVGHGGTLDPFAAGVLPVFMGFATRLVEYHLTDEKEYRALICFGARSTTDDLDGELTPTDRSAPTRAQVEDALVGMRGEIEQVPPDYSAVRVAGRKAYELARHGEKPELRARRVTIHRLELTEWNDDDPERPVATLEMRCSAGTYVRSLARDLGEQLGCGAYLGALTRTASGPFRIDQAHPLARVREELGAGRAEELLLAPDAGLEAFPELTLTTTELGFLARGQQIRPSTVGLGDGLVRVRDESGRLVAMARLGSGVVSPEKVFLAAHSE